MKLIIIAFVFATFTLLTGTFAYLIYRRTKEVVEKMGVSSGATKFVLGMEGGCLACLFIVSAAVPLIIAAKMLSQFFSISIIYEIITEVIFEVLREKPYILTVFYMFYGITSAAVNIFLGIRIKETIVLIIISGLIAAILHTGLFNHLSSEDKKLIPLFLFSSSMVSLRLYFGLK